MNFKKNLFLALIALFSYSISAQKSTQDFSIVFEKSNGEETGTYQETIAFYKKLATTYPEISLLEMGETDSGYPLHLVVFNSSKEFDFNKINDSKKTIILINNAIHPGEPDGVDASMMLLRNLVQDKNKINELKNVVLAVIPMYNIGGALNRNSHSRANQNGPKEYGFRGNAENYDLNRDFIKADTKNAKAFAEIFHLVKPDIFIDNHVSNGADYQYGITHLFTQHNNLGNDLGDFIENEMKPNLEASLLKKNISITPYVNVWGTTPEAGFSQFFDSPRYSTGYSTLFNTFGMMVETH
ncbi:MAG: M14 family metallopeptidase, partial [Lutibacter sp.]